MKVLYSCVGGRDLKAANTQDDHRKGPVADAILGLDKEITDVVLWLDRNREDDEADRYLKWLRKQVRSSLQIHTCWMGKADPTDFGWVFSQILKTFEGEKQTISERLYLVGPGTPTMTTCTLLLSHLEKYQGKLIQTDEKAPEGYRRLQLPMQVEIKYAASPEAMKGKPPNDPESKGDRVTKCSASTKQAWEDAERIAKSDWPVLILGASGTGKEEVARHLHECRKRGEFVPVNCGAIPENLIESELFGYEKGAFTGAKEKKIGIFEAAGDGTVFLDEIGELPLVAQVRLLRVLQEGKVRPVGSNKEVKLSCRVVAATHRDLWQRMQDGSFREDLYYRLAVLIIQLEPLARRPEDLQKMIDVFWEEIIQKNQGFPGKELSGEAKEHLLAYDWPGNVRELHTVLVRASFIAKSSKVGKEDIERAIGRHKTSPTQVDSGLSDEVVAVPNLTHLGNSTQNVDFRSETKAFQRRLIEKVLEQHDKNKTKAAHALGISPQHLSRILKEL